MKIEVEFIQVPTPVTVISLIGELDASNYTILVEKASDLYQSGTRNLLIDLSQMPFMASSGLVAFHRVALIMREEYPTEPHEQWNPMQAIAHEVHSKSGHDHHCKLLNPQSRVTQTLQVTGFDKILAVYFDKKEALASFS